MVAAELVLVPVPAQESASEHRPAVVAEWEQASVSVQVSARAPVSAVVVEV